MRQLCMGYDARGLQWKAARTRQGRGGRMKGGSTRNAARFHGPVACRSARLGGESTDRESGENPPRGAASAAASPVPPPSLDSAMRRPAGAPGLSTCSPTPSATAWHAATCSSARTLSRSHHRTSASAAWTGCRAPSPFDRPSSCASMGKGAKKGEGSPRRARASVASSTDRARRRRARGVQQSHETVDMMPSPTEAAASPSPYQRLRDAGTSEVFRDTVSDHLLYVFTAGVAAVRVSASHAPPAPDAAQHTVRA